MEQYIKIKAKDEEGHFLGTFKLSIESKNLTESMDSISDKGSEKKLDGSIYNIPSNSSLVLYNVPMVYEFDDRTPIQFYKNSENNVNIMLLEDYRYNLSFKPNNNLGKEYDNLEVFHSLLKFDEETLQLFPESCNGFLSFGSYVGKSFIDIYRNNKPIFKIPFEVRSRKIDYATQYAAMIGDLSKYSQGLIYESKSPLFIDFINGDVREKFSYEEFMLLEYLFKEENLPSAVEYLSRNLYSALTDTTDEVPTSFASNINPNDLIDVFSNSDNLYELGNGNLNSNNLNNPKINDSVWSRQTKGYVPLRINETKYIDNIDVPENRFYKSFLESVENLINDLLEKVNEDTYIHDQLLIYKETISAYLAQRYFKDISMMDYVPLNSQLLQKKEGYRDILQYYLMFELGFALKWDELTDEFKGNEKKLYRLYEYWCYFELAEIMKDLSGIRLDFDDIFSYSKDDMAMSLKEGIVQKFNLDLEGKDVRIDLLYNRKFNSSSNNVYKSYSVELRPDYSLVFYIDGKRHILHFDAKYKLNIYDESFKNEDVVKMHAYKDAILDTVGSYVLYPGEKNQIYYESQDKLGSVGAFPLNPGDSLENRKRISKFIYERILDFL